MIRYILLGILFFFLFRWVRRVLLIMADKRAKGRQNTFANEMIRCKVCGTFISKATADSRGGDYRCAVDCSTERR